MRIPRFSVSGFLLLLLVAACGGGGGGAPAPQAPMLLGLFQAALSGAAEVTVVDASARATAYLELLSDGTLSFAVTGEAAWTGSVTGLHVHGGAAGVNGAIVVDLLSDGAAFGGASHTATDSFAIAPALAAQIAASPASFYVNVHTTAASGGLARAQLAPYVAADWHAVISASDEVPSNGSGAHGAASLRVSATRSLAWVAALTSPSVAALTDAHVHVGGSGTNGSILVDLQRGSATADLSLGTLTGAVPIPIDALARIAFDPAGFYVNVHTAALPAGAARGQLASTTVELWAPLRGDRETTVVDGAARGGATLELLGSTAGRVILAVPVAQGIASVTDAHVHAGLAGTNGAVLVDLDDAPDYDAGVATGSAEGSISYPQAVFARLLANPAAFYVNLHTAAAPNGLVRGQLTQAPQSLVATLSGSNQVPPVSASNAGRAKVTLTGVHASSFQIDMTSPSASALTGVHIHDGIAGANGPILVDFLTGAEQVNGNTMTGAATFTGRTFARLLANAAAFYVNVHTTADPAGAARGPLLLLTEDAPPAGLAYTTPSPTYLTGGPIAPNVPDSIGGAVTSYAVAPALPPGLLLDSTTGILSGTPTVAAAPQDYVVTASNAAGNAQATLHITVAVGAPTGVTYSTPVIYVVGTAIVTNSPSHTGGAPDTFGVTPALPAGLTLDAGSGDITGTPTAAASAADYTVTASNAAGSVQTTVNVRVDATLQAPSGLTYDTPKTYGTGTAISPNTPAVGGGPVDSYSVSPALPAGLSLDGSTGVIAGTPTTVTAAATYTVTATNAAGSTQGTVSITIVLGAPANLTYDITNAVGYVSGGTFPTMTPSSEGGTVASYSITPALPAGLALNTTTGVISGSPTATSAQATYTVTATNAAGSASKQVVITVLQ